MSSRGAEDGPLLRVRRAARPLSGICRVPGDKSLSHRALLFSALGSSRVEIRGLGLGQDNTATAGALRALGVPIDHQAGQGSAVVQGVGFHGLRSSVGDIDCGNSGTTIRLLCGLLAGRPFATTLFGDPSLSRRPMGRIARPLMEMGARVTGRMRPDRPGELFAPLVVEGGQLHGIHYALPVASAQLKTALVLAGLQARGRTVITEPELSRDHTERMLVRLGAPIVAEPQHRRVIVDPTTATRPWTGALDTSASPIIEVPGDISSAAFVLAAAVVVPGSDVTVEGVGLNPTRTGILDVLLAMGARIDVEVKGETMGEPWGNVRARHGRLVGVRIAGELALRCLDEVPVLAMVAAVADGPTEFADLAELRVKESDRIASIARELRRAGVGVEEASAGLTVAGGAKRIAGGRVHPDHDHRIAMAAAVLGLLSDEETEIPSTDIGTSFPGFAVTLAGLGAQIDEGGTLVRHHALE